MTPSRLIMTILSWSSMVDWATVIFWWGPQLQRRVLGSRWLRECIKERRGKYWAKNAPFGQSRVLQRGIWCACCGMHEGPSSQTDIYSTESKANVGIDKDKEHWAWDLNYWKFQHRENICTKCRWNEGANMSVRRTNNCKCAIKKRGD